MLILGPILDLDGPNPESWYRCAKTQTVEVHFLQGNQSTPCLRLEQSEHTAGTPLPSLSGRGESQPLYPHWDGAEEEQAPFLPLIPYPAQTSQDNLPQLQRDPLFGQSLPAGLSNPTLLSPQYGQLALATLNYPSKCRLCWQPFLPSFQLFLRNRQAGPKHPCCRELHAERWPSSQSPLPQSHVSLGFPL